MGLTKREIILPARVVTYEDENYRVNVLELLGYAFMWDLVKKAESDAISVRKFLREVCRQVTADVIMYNRGSRWRIILTREVK